MLPPAYARARVLLGLLGALVLLPLTVVLTAVPASAAAFQLTGTVQDAVGEPLAGVKVEALAAPADTVAATTSTTTADGGYTLSGLGAGTYHLRFTKAGYRDTWYGDDTDREDVAVDAGGVASDDDGPLTDNTVPDVQLTSPATHPVTGTVTAGGSPVGGITVTAYLDGDDEEPGVSTTTAAGTGAYTLDLETGSWEIRYSDPGYVGVWYGADNAASDTATAVVVRTDGSVRVEDAGTGCGGAAPATLCPVALTAVAGGEEHPVTGRVVDANGEPVEDVTVKLLQAGTSTVVDQNLSDPDGGYRIDAVAGTYNLAFSGAGWVSTTYKTGDPEVTAAVTVAPNGDLSTTPVEQLTHNALSDVTLGSTPTSYDGTVVAAGSGNPVSGVQVRAFPTDDPDAAVTDTTDGSGDYTLALPIGQYEIQFTDPSNTYVQTWLGGTTHAAVKVAQGSPRVLTVDGTPVSGFDDVAMSEPPLDAVFPVSGEVVDANGDGIAGVQVSAAVTTPGAAANATTLGDGSYTLQLEAGSYTISFHDPSAVFDNGTLRNEGDTASAVVSVSGTGVVTVDGQASSGPLDSVTLSSGVARSVSGSVTNAGSTGLVGITVNVYAIDDLATPLGVSTTTTTGGAYTISNLHIGTYAVELVDNVNDATTYSTTWLPGGDTAKELVIAQGGKVYLDGVQRTSALGAVVMPAVTAETTYNVKGEVVDAVGTGLGNIHVDASVVSTGQAASEVTTTDGDYTLKLKPGRYNLTYSGSLAAGAADNYTTATYRNDEDELAIVSVAANGTIAIEGNDPDVIPGGELSAVSLVGQAKHAISGSVTSVDGSALAGITVEAIVDGDSAAYATTTSNGSGGFAFSLPVNDYKFRFTDNVADGRNYQVTWFGGVASALVTVRTDGTFVFNGAAIAGLGATSMPIVTVVDLAGTVSDPVDFDPLDGVTVTAIPVSGTAAGSGGSDVTGPDPLTAGSLGDAGVYRIPVKPGKYQLRFEKAGYATMYLTADDPLIPAVITVAANGTISVPDLELTDGVFDDLSLLFPATAFKTNPKLTGKVAVGQTVTATLGALAGASIDNDYVYLEWFLNGVPADDYSFGSVYQKFKVTTAAAGKKLSFRITIDDPDGQRASSVFTSKPVSVPKATATLKGTVKKGKLTVTVKVPTLPRPTGKLVVKDGKKKVATVKLSAKSKGKAVVKLSKLKPGKHKLTISYAGPASVAPAKKVVKVTIRK